jgi:hypothetical protein
MEEAEALCRTLSSEGNAVLVTLDGTPLAGNTVHFSESIPAKELLEQAAFFNGRADILRDTSLTWLCRQSEQKIHFLRFTILSFLGLAEDALEKLEEKIFPLNSSVKQWIASPAASERLLREVPAGAKKRLAHLLQLLMQIKEDNLLGRTSQLIFDKNLLNSADYQLITLYKEGLPILNLEEESNAEIECQHQTQEITLAAQQQNKIVTDHEEQQRIQKANEEEYQTALIELEKSLATLSSDKQEIIVQAQKMIEQVKQLKSEGTIPIKTLILSLKTTYELLQGNIDPGNYKKSAERVEKSASIGMKILGAIMLTLGVLVAAVGIVLAATGAGIAVGITTGAAGAGLSAVGLGIFNVKKNKTPEADEQDNSNSLVPIKT